MWETSQNRVMTKQQEATLKAGCIGITALNLGINTNSPLKNAYSTFAAAQTKAKLMEADLKKNPQNYPKDAHVVIFSKRFYSSDSKKFLPNAKKEVDMTGYNYQPKPGGYTNFDYGFYDKNKKTWFHANHCDGCSGSPMKVYESTLDWYSRPLLDFNRQIFVPVISILPKPAPKTKKP